MNYYYPQYQPIFQPNDPNLTTISVHLPPAPPPPPLQAPQQQNKFIYIKQKFVNPNYLPPIVAQQKAKTVLVNPHFKPPNIHINPQFRPLANNKPTKIHVNPNVLRNLTSGSNNNDNKIPPKIVDEKKVIEVETLVSTRTKIVRAPKKTPHNDITELDRKRRHSWHTKYKIVRSSSKTVERSPQKHATLARGTPVSRNTFKLDNRRRTSAVNTTIAKHVKKKKYVYINRFLSVSAIAKTVLFKQTSRLNNRSLLEISGIMYKKSPNSLKILKHARSSSSSNSFMSSKYKMVRRHSDRAMKVATRKSLVKRNKIIRDHKSKASPSQLKKSNVPCPIYRKYGKCPGKSRGTCIKIHNPDRIALCTRFLQGACLKRPCLFSHKISPEKMPTCKYYLEGQCSRDDCPYLHVKISAKADICKDFLEGFCERAAECDKRHQFLCPVHERNGSCTKRKCPYPHGNLVRQHTVFSSMIAKKFSKNNKLRHSSSTVVKTAHHAVDRAKLVKSNCDKGVVVAGSSRYYCKDKESLSSSSSVNIKETVDGDDNNDRKFDLVSRPKLGDLPAFIPIDKGVS